MIIRTVSGPGYGYSISRDVTAPAFVVSLGWQGLRRYVPCDTYGDACTLGERFADVGRAWHVYTSRNAALARGIAVIG